MAPAGAGAGPRKGPAKSSTNYSRKFGSSEKADRLSYIEADDYSLPTKKTQRSTTFASPLDIFDKGQSATGRNRSAGQSRPNSISQLTDENLALLQAAHRQADSLVPTRDEGSDSRFDEEAWIAHMRKSKSKSPEKKSHSKKKSKNINEHPLNLPPDELKRLSARMARDEKRASAQMDVDIPEDSASHGSDEAQPDNGTNSNPASPGTDNTPGAFPNSEHMSNGDSREDTKSPPPPPHRINTQPKMDPEAAKAAGNKFFKAKDYGRAVVEYSKGWSA